LQQENHQGENIMSGKANNRSHNKIVIERRYEASIEDVWELWTTRSPSEN
jgi:hypothetical protein